MNVHYHSYDAVVVGAGGAGLRAAIELAGGYVPESVKGEIKRNAIKRIRDGLVLIEGMVGYEDSVLPQVENAILADHDIILLGERGQGKTKLIRSLVGLLDEFVPVLVGGELNDDPLAPISRSGRQILESQGISAKVAYLNRNDRYGEKLATPDTSMADLVGEGSRLLLPVRHTRS